MSVNPIDPNSFTLLAEQIPPLVNETTQEYKLRIQKTLSDQPLKDSPTQNPLTAQQFIELTQQVLWDGQEINEYIKEIEDKL